MPVLYAELAVCLQIQGGGVLKGKWLEAHLSHHHHLNECSSRVISFYINYFLI